ncbi:MAG: hydrogenase/urease maturation nickel metallochaperone HypA [Candidatus Palauibacterales bacterium]|nr:hydrogenase/urease maturation nickel metallochaperone HypA [Candidatus Palauibacterales bacterium]MDP2529017.1 hydrogenase/urease maturation nickel metallochaperone HypA [Candidatus Palauibacterales bacterium]MDP2583836.1 hydrogenase/urease maturation nickel metallochaperone HypA [Candidatus Palauibacterales bacterium]
MHEMSLALEICRITEEHVGTARLGDVRVVALEVGDDAGVERANLEFCLEALLGSPPFGAARPVIEPAPGDVFRVKYLEVEDDGPDDRRT